MHRFVPIHYRDFWDVPRIFIVEYKGYSFLFDCPFDEDLEDYPTVYRVYLVPALDPAELAGSWVRLLKKVDKFLEEISIDLVVFDPSKRKEINAVILDELISHLKPKQIIAQTSS